MSRDYPRSGRVYIWPNNINEVGHVWLRDSIQTRIIQQMICIQHIKYISRYWLTGRPAMAMAMWRADIYIKIKRSTHSYTETYIQTINSHIVAIAHAAQHRIMCMHNKTKRHHYKCTMEHMYMSILYIYTHSIYIPKYTNNYLFAHAHIWWWEHASSLKMKTHSHITVIMGARIVPQASRQTEAHRGSR